MARPDLSKLHPLVLSKVQSWLTLCQQSGHLMTLTSAIRTPIAQFALHTNGRTLLETLTVAIKDARYSDVVAQVTHMQSAGIEDKNIRKKLFLMAGLPADDALRVNKVTWTLNSRHLPDAAGFGHAVDFVVLNKTGMTLWTEKADVDNDKKPDYQEIGVLAEQCGLVWGGRWKKQDLPHVEFVC